MKALNAETTIVRRLRNDIAQGLLQPGAPLLQDELAERFAVSRVPIRDALKALEADGLITFLANRTAIVTVLGAEDIEEMFSIRQMLECDLISRALAQATAADHRAVRQLLGQLDAATSGPQFAELDRAFHAALYRPARRPRQQAIVDKLGPQLARFYGGTLDFAGYHQDCQGSHHAIADAFVRREADRACACLGGHLDQARQKIMTLVTTHKE